MTQPTILPTKWAGDTKAWLRAKVDRSGDPRIQYTTVSIPSGTTVGNLVGLVPFQKGARFNLGASRLRNDALGASVTVNIGYIYDDNANNTNDTDAFASLLAANAAGDLVYDESATALPWVASDNGWIVAEVAGATTGSAGTISGFVGLVYDGWQSVN